MFLCWAYEDIISFCYIQLLSHDCCSLWFPSHHPWLIHSNTCQLTTFQALWAESPVTTVWWFQHLMQNRCQDQEPALRTTVVTLLQPETACSSQCSTSQCPVTPICPIIQTWQNGIWYIWAISSLIDTFNMYLLKPLVYVRCMMYNRDQVCLPCDFTFDKRMLWILYY